MKNDEERERLVRILFVEDAEDDVLLIVHELRRGGYATDWARVETASALRSALALKRWDLVITDYCLPRFSASEALALVRELEPDLPCVVISGAMTESVVEATLKFGANDYLLKGHLSRLCVVVARQLQDAAERARLRENQAALEQKEAYLEAVFDNIPVGVITMDAGARIEWLNSAAAAVFEVDAGEMIGGDFKQLLADTASHGSGRTLGEALGVRDPTCFSGEILGRRSGALFLFELVTSAMDIGGRTVIIAAVRESLRRPRVERGPRPLLPPDLGERMVSAIAAWHGS